MVGASLAAALEPLGLRAALIEAHVPTSGRQPSYDDRATVISAGSRRILEAIGVWGGIEAVATPVQQVHVSDRGRFAFARLDRREFDVPALGYVIENRILGKVLWEFLAQSSNLHKLVPARVTDIQSGDEEVSLEVQDPTPRRISAAVVVGADGAQSVVRRLLGLGTRTWSYRQSAVVANVSPSRFHSHVAYERFTDEGPLALLPMSDGRCACIWTVDTAVADRLRDASGEEFCAQLQAAFGNRLGKFSKVGARRTYPLELVRADTLTFGGRVAFIGNAAQGLHPIAAQGFNLGLRDVAALADALTDFRSSEGALNADSACLLDRYAAGRLGDRHVAIGMTDGLVRLFTSPLFGIRAARALGLLAFDMIGPVKTSFTKHSMGMGGRQSRLARGVPLPATPPHDTVQAKGAS
ncbi:2-octaprenyl-6-methoxyphenyl hydroxylase [soil metagenome]